MLTPEGAVVCAMVVMWISPRAPCSQLKKWSSDISAASTRKVMRIVCRSIARTSRPTVKRVHHASTLRASHVAACRAVHGAASGTCLLHRSNSVIATCSCSNASGGVAISFWRHCSRGVTAVSLEPNDSLGVAQTVVDAADGGVVASFHTRLMNVVTVRHDSPLGSWTLSTWRPAPLAGLVDVIWYSEGTTEQPRERAFPNGKVQLRVNLGEPYRLVEDTGTRGLGTAWLSGLESGPRVIELPARHRCLAVLLRPAGTHALLARPMHEVSGLTVDLQDLVGRAAGELAERCHDALSIEARFRLAAEWISERVVGSHGVDEGIAWVATQIERRGGAVSITTLREQTGLSKARLTATFREQIGVTPKLYARIVRFRRALALLHQGAGPLADVALAAGYYDQPHMNAEFRELGGLTPREFLATRYPDGVTAAEAAS